jgi:exosortase/archaeosortase family protein
MKAKKRKIVKTPAKKAVRPAPKQKATPLSPIIHPIKELLEQKNFVQFFSRLLISIFAFGFALTALDLSLSTTVGYLVFNSHISAFRIWEINYAVGSMFTQVFFLIVLYLIAKPKLYALKEIKSSPNWYVYALFTVISFAIYANIKSFIILEHEAALGMQAPLFFLKYFTLVLTVLFLLLTLIDRQAIIRVIKRFWKEGLVAFIFIQIFNKAAMTLLYSYELFTNEWVIFAKITSIGTAGILSLFMSGVTYSFESVYRPIVMTPSFSGIIARSCSGIIGLSLFALLFGLILVMDWRRINKGKAIASFVVGLAGIVFINIIRITSLFLVGIYVSREFALGLFHTNIGLVLFLLYFLIFEFYTYNWLRK